MNQQDTKIAFLRVGNVGFSFPLPVPMRPGDPVWEAKAAAALQEGAERHFAFDPAPHQEVQ
jgi:hypothetical protein